MCSAAGQWIGRSSALSAVPVGRSKDRATGDRRAILGSKGWQAAGEAWFEADDTLHLLPEPHACHGYARVAALQFVDIKPRLTIILRRIR
jgi:hypothetical protein